MPASMILASIYGSTFMAAAALGSFGLAAATFAINFAVSMIVTRTFGSGNANQSIDNGVRQQVPPSTTNSIPIVYGDAYLGGMFVDAVLSNDQKTMYYVMAISQISPNGQFSIDVPTSLTSDKFMYWQDQKIEFDTSDLTKVVSLTDGADNIQTKISGNLYINLYTSDEAGNITSLNGAAAPTTVMGGSDIAPEQQWVSTTLAPRKMNGLAFAIIKMVYNRDAGTTQMQPITFHASHYLNSTGVAKPGDVWYDYITNTKYGCSMDATIVDATTATALNTYSDEVITYTPAAGGSATQPRYRINGVIDTGQDVLSNLDQIMLACDSWNQYNAATGKWAVVINKAESSSFAFDDTNIIGEIRVSAFDIASSINQIQAQFPSKLNRDQSDYVYLNTPEILKFANEPDNKYTINLGLVNDSVQAQYLANRMLEQAREDLIVTFATTYNGIQVDAGDVISVTNAAYGWTDKLFRVIKVSEASLPDGNLGASLELNEYNAAVYDNASITAYAPAPNSNLSNPNFFSNLTAPTVANINTTATIPHFDVVCGIPATGRVTEVTLFYTSVTSPTTTDWKVWSIQTASNSQPFSPSTNLVFSDLNLPTETYYFSFKVANESGASILSAVSTSFSWAPNPTTSAVAGTFLATFSPIVLQVPRDASLVPSFTGLISQLYGSAAGGAVDFVASQDDSDSAFVNNTWRIGASSTTGYGDITTTGGLALPSPTDGGTFAQWGIPTAMTSSPATLTVPVRYKSVLGTVTQGATSVLQFVFVDQGQPGGPGAPGNQAANPTLYQWSATTPSNPSGQSTYTWATGVNSSYTGGGGWTTSIPSNPTTAGIQLWTAVKPTVVTAGTTTSTVSWTSGYTISSVTSNGINGLQTARPTVYKWALTLPASPVGTSTYTWSTNSFSPDPSGWSSSITTSPSTGYTLWAAAVNISDTATATSTTINWGLSSIIASGYAPQNGDNGSRTAVLEMYQWAASIPTTFPSGTSTYTWATGLFTAPATTNSWTLTPGTSSPGQTLWITRTIYSDSLTSATSSVTWSASAAYPAGAAGLPGANGTRTAFLEVYQWAGSSPSTFPAGTSTYTWANGSFTNPSTPNGWSVTPGTPTPGQSLYACAVRYSDTATTASSTVTWNTTVSYVVGTTGTSGTDGLSSRICYAKSTSSSLNSTPATYVTTGAGTFPPTNTWGGAETWVATPPTLTAGEALFQSDGIYNPSTSQTTWNVPYLSNLKVGSLSAITANTGNLTVSGTIQSNTAAISGTTMTGSGAVIYSSGNFAVGNSTNNITYNGSAITLNGTVVFPSNINSNNLTLKDGSGNVILGNGTPLNYGNITPASGWLNSNITVTSGAIGGIGSGSGTVVANDQIYISSGNIYGIGSGAGTPVANSLISLGTLGAGGFAYLSQITSANVSTYIAGAAIGTAQVGVLTAGNIGAGTIDAGKIAANTITAGQIAANTITADRMSVSNLSAIAANLGTITAGSISGASLSVGTSPAVSGTTMTGAGAKINTDGTFALGNSSTNISYNGTQMSLNGNVVATGNINANAVTVTNYTQLNSIVNFASYVTGDALSITINTGGQPVLMIYSFYVVWGSGATTGGNQFLVEMKIDGVAVKQSNFIGISSAGGASFIQGVAYLANPSSGNFNVSITLSVHLGNYTVSFYPVTQQQLGSYFYVLGTKR